MPVNNSAEPDRLKGLRLVRVLNEQAVLEAILHDGETSRPAIARKTGLSLPTIVSLVDTMKSIGLVREEGQTSGGIGRPATLYSVDPLAGYVFAAVVGGSTVRAGIADLCGGIVAERVESTAHTNIDAIIDQLRGLHGALLKESDFDPDTTGVACIGVPGVWHPKTDRISAAYNLPALAEVPLKATVQRGIGLSVVIENDVNLAAVGESWKGRAREYDTFVAFFIGTGIGMGIVIDGEVYRGRTGAAGEIGLLPIGSNPFDSSLRARGPFEIAASEASIHTRLQRVLTEGVESSLSSAAEIAEIIDAAQAGDEVARIVLEDEARTVATGVAAVVTVLDPDIVILGGRIGSHSELAKLVYSYATQLVPWMPPVEASTLGNRASFYGAVAVGLQVAREQKLVEMRSTK